MSTISASHLQFRSLRIVATIGLIVLTGCISNPPTSQEIARQSNETVDIGKMDTTMGTYGAGRENNLLLVTMNTRVHRQLLDGIADSASELDESKLPVIFRQFLNELSIRYGVTRVADWPLDSLSIRCLVFEINDAQPTEPVIAALSQHENIESVQAVQMFNTNSENYNDPYLPLQHGFRTMQAGLSHRWATGMGVSVAVIDTGLDDQHSEIKHSISSTANFVDKNREKFQSDQHGTAVTGIISAAANNATGLVGIAPDANIVAMKACWSKNAEDNQAICNSYTLAKAINVAIRRKVDIINLSLAGPRDPLLERLIDVAESKNIVVIGARDPVHKHYFPAALDNVIAAGLPGDTTSRTVIAPGSKIISTAPGNQYNFFSGSSFSTAHLSGLTALLRELDSELNHETLRDLISRAHDQNTGGINVCTAITQLLTLDEGVCVTEGPAVDT